MPVFSQDGKYHCLTCGTVMPQIGMDCPMCRMNDSLNKAARESEEAKSTALNTEMARLLSKLSPEERAEYGRMRLELIKPSWAKIIGWSIAGLYLLSTSYSFLHFVGWCVVVGVLFGLYFKNLK
jgi:predicted ATP-dependent serine protease